MMNFKSFKKIVRSVFSRNLAQDQGFSEWIESITKINKKEPSIDKDFLKNYPKAKPGFVRYVINLPSLKVERNYKIELYGGKEMKINRNPHFLLGKFYAKRLSNSAYSYLEFKSNGDVGRGLMGCGNEDKQLKFVSSPEHLVRYENHLPIVIYVPEGLEIRYKVWKKYDVEYNAEIG